MSVLGGTISELAQAVDPDGIATTDTATLQTAPTNGALRTGQIETTGAAATGQTTLLQNAVLQTGWPTPPPPDPPFLDLTEIERIDEVDDARTAFANTGDPAAFNDVDTFRQHLSFQERRDYDEWLDEVRQNNDINIQYWDGATPDPLVEELIYRGIAASTFRRDGVLDDTIAVAEQYELYTHWDFGAGVDEVAGRLPNANGQFDIYVYPDDQKIGFGVATESGDIMINQDALINTVTSDADNAIIHEFAYIEQFIEDDRSWFERLRGADEEHAFTPFPQDFPDEDLFNERVQSPEFDAVLAPYGYIGPTTAARSASIANGSIEVYPTVLNLFMQRPDELKSGDPELYDLMVEHTGLDPADS